MTAIKVYPACAGIDPRRNGLKKTVEGLPRMRGDRPGRWIPIEYQQAFTPHARGSTRQNVPCPSAIRVYPACAGIDLLNEDYIPR